MSRTEHADPGDQRHRLGARSLQLRARLRARLDVPGRSASRRPASERALTIESDGKGEWTVDGEWRSDLDECIDIDWSMTPVHQHAADPAPRARRSRTRRTCQVAYVYVPRPRGDARPPALHAARPDLLPLRVARQRLHGRPDRRRRRLRGRVPGALRATVDAGMTILVTGGTGGLGRPTVAAPPRRRSRRPGAQPAARSRPGRRRPDRGGRSRRGRRPGRHRRALRDEPSQGRSRDPQAARRREGGRGGVTSSSSRSSASTTSRTSTTATRSSSSG